MTNVLETPRIVAPTDAEMLRKVRDKYVPANDAYAKAFLSELAARLIRAEAERPCFDTEDRYRYAIEQALHLLELGRDFDISHAKVWLRNALAGLTELPDHIPDTGKMVKPLTDAVCACIAATVKAIEARLTAMGATCPPDKWVRLKSCEVALRNAGRELREDGSKGATR